MSADEKTAGGETRDVISGHFMKPCILNQLSADVSDAVHRVAEASRGLSVCEEKQDRLVLLYGLQRDEKVS